MISKNEKQKHTTGQCRLFTNIVPYFQKFSDFKTES